MIPDAFSRRAFLAGAVMSRLLALPLTRLTDKAGAALPGAFLESFETGTERPAPLYASADLETVHTQPLRADAEGRLPPIFLDPAKTYRLKVRTAAGGVIEGLDFDPVSALNAQSINFAPGDPRAVQRSVAAKLGDVVSILDFHDPARGTDVTDALEHLAYRAFAQLQALTIYFPPGYYRLSRQIIPARQLNLRGAGISASLLDFRDVAALNPVMRGAIAYGTRGTLQAYDPEVAGKVAGPGEYGSGFSTIDGLTLRVSGSRAAELHYGLWSAAPLFVHDVVLDACGAKFAAGNLQSRAGAVAGNANHSCLINVHSLYATEHGFMADGSDVNACTFLHCNAFVPKFFGFYEAGFLGNSYVSPKADGGGIATCGFKFINPTGANRSSIISPECEDNFRTPYDVEAGSVIIAPIGAKPQPGPAGRNSVLSASAGAGLAVGGRVTFNAQLDTYQRGDATHPAAFAAPGGFFVRGQGDGHEYYFIARDGEGIGGGGEGASLIKRLTGTELTYELIHFGHSRNRPAFPQGLIIDLPVFADNDAARAAGLAEGEMYRTARGEVRVTIGDAPD